MEDLRERLLRLRKEGASSAGTAAPRESLPQWFLDRAQRVVGGGDDLETGLEIGAAQLAGCTEGPPRDLEASSNACGEFAARVELYAGDHRHGAASLDTVDGIDARAFELLTRDGALRELDPRATVYLDIETTGLSGGAGTQAFMVGLGRFVRDERGERFELWQGFLREPGEERALLHACAERIRAARGIVSFFGKAFDRHRLEDKMRMHGVAPPFDDLPHLDLFHPCRRLYRGVLADAKLRTMERALCGVEREADLPGSFAPAAWMDFQRGRPHLLEKVFEHNRDDVLSLVVLCAHVGRALTARERAEPAELDTAAVRLEWSRTFALALVCSQRKLWSECALWAERAAALGPTAALARQASWLQANAQRRGGDPSSALELFARLAHDARDGIAARAAFEASRIDPAGAWLERAHDLASTLRGPREMEQLLARVERARARAAKAHAS